MNDGVFVHARRVLKLPALRAAWPLIVLALCGGGTGLGVVGDTLLSRIKRPEAI